MGERQRVMIARALSTKPRLLLADEPTGSLDTQRGREVLELLRELCRERGVAVVLVSHDPMAARYADRVFVLRDGKLCDYDADGTARAHAAASSVPTHASRAGDGRRERRREAGERPAPLPRAAARAAAAGVSRDRRDRRGGRAAVRLAGLELEPAELRRRSSSTGSPATRRCSSRARDPQGFPQSMLARVRAIPGVRIAAPLLEAERERDRPARAASRSSSSAPIEPVARWGARSCATPRPHPVRGDRRGRAAGAARARRSACAVRPGSDLPARRPHRRRRRSTPNLGERQIGPLAREPDRDRAAVLRAGNGGLQGRVSRILSSPRPGAQAACAAALAALAAGRLNVESVDYDATLFAKAAAASNQSTRAVLRDQRAGRVSVRVQRDAADRPRAPAADRRSAPRRLRAATVIAVLLLDALALGVIACALGLGARRGALDPPVALRIRLPLARLRRRLASGRELRRRRDRRGRWHARGDRRRCSARCATILSRDPLAATGARERRRHAPAPGSGARRACLSRGGHARCCSPTPTRRSRAWSCWSRRCSASCRSRSARRSRSSGGSRALIVSPVPHVAAMELSAGPARAVAIAATGAIAVFGSVAIEGAHGDLLAGLRTARARNERVHAMCGSRRPAPTTCCMTTPFAPLAQAAPAQRSGGALGRPLPQRAARLRRAPRAVIAPPRRRARCCPRDQLARGDAHRATARVRAGGWLSSRRRSPPNTTCASASRSPCRAPTR